MLRLPVLQAEAMASDESSATPSSGGELRKVLDDIVECKLSGSTRKALAYKAVELAMKSDVCLPTCAGSHIGHLEGVLAAVAE